jgi:predicted nucleic acid-binding protein
LLIPTSVLGEVAAICIKGKKHTPDELHKIVDLLSRYGSQFLHPSQLVAEICYNLYSDAWRDDRMQPSDLVHLGYSLAYNVDYFITSDRNLHDFRIPEDYKLKVLTPSEAIKRFQWVTRKKEPWFFPTRKAIFSVAHNMAPTWDSK